TRCSRDWSSDVCSSDLQRLGSSAKHLVHRDFQSQNLLLKDGKAWWIDFQGMRRGRQEYDIASLVFDPYMDRSEEDREAILSIWRSAARRVGRARLARRG